MAEWARAVRGGGGGGGYFGGGGGASGGASLAGAASGGGGGGGGSGFGPAGTSFQSGLRSGNGSALIRYTMSDTTPPTASPTQNPAANSAGWDNSDVTVTWNWADNPGGSGIDPAHCTQSSTSSGEGTLTLTATCTDLAGNQGTASYTVKVDKTPPELLLSGSDAGPSGWITTAPAFAEVIASDRGSQLAAETCSDAVNGGAPSVLFSATAVQTTFTSPQLITGNGTHVVSCTMSDGAGNSTTQSLTLKLDTTAPTITAAATTQPNANGWYTGPVTVQFTCSDAPGGSGLAAGACPADQVLSTEGAAISSTAQTVSDIAGNTSAPSNVVTVKIDHTPPVVAVTGVTDGASYTLGSVPQAGCSTTDSLSGVATRATLALSGGNANGVGSFTASCSGGTDAAGNAAAPISVHYTVGYHFSGFQAPVSNPPAVNSGKAGRAYPLNFQLTNGSGGFIRTLSAVTSVTYQSVSCGSFSGASDALDAGTVGNSGLQYDATTHTYTYVWKTPSAAGCYVLTLTLDSGQTFTADFNLR